MIECTVAICTYNGAARIGQVLTGLSKQTDITFDWEILLINNASTDNTNDICKQIASKLCLNNLRIVLEKTPGLSFARRRAAIEAKGKIILFLDDDNPPDHNFVANAYNFFCEHPKAGMVGGRIYPIWEAEPTELVLKVCNFALAICDQGENAFKYEGIFSGPVGAGMCVRYELLYQLFLEKGAKLADSVLGRKGASLMGGEDIAMAALSNRLGWENWYEPSICCGHIIPKKRMDFAYLDQLFECTGRSQAAVRRLMDWKARNPVTAIVIAAKDLMRYLCQYFKFNQLGTNENLAKQLNALEKKLLSGRIIETLRWWK